MPPLVTIYHGRDVGHEHWRSGLAGYANLFRTGALHLTVNRNFADMLIEGGAPPARVAVHHLGIPVRDYAFDPARPAGPLRLISLCRLVEKKGLTQAIEALALLAARHPNIAWHYEIVGSGPLEAALRRQVAAARLQSRISFSGAQPHADALRRIAAADALLAPSITAADGDQEGIPITLMEAMALGTIACATRHSGTPELIDHGRTGLLAAEGDAEGLFRNLHAIAEGRIDRQAMSKAARATIKAEFDEETRNAALLEQLHRVTGPIPGGDGCPHVDGKGPHFKSMD